LLAPAVASVSLAANTEGAFDTPFESARAVEALTQTRQLVANVNLTIPAWQGQAGGAPILLAAQTAGLPALVIYDSGLEALPIGGFDGTTPVPTLSELQADVRAGRFHLVWIASDADPRLRWLATRCLHQSKRFYLCASAAAG
jgi:hypothetical protein